MTKTLQDCYIILYQLPASYHLNNLKYNYLAIRFHKLLRYCHCMQQLMMIMLNWKNLNVGDSNNNPSWNAFWKLFTNVFK